MSVFSLRTASRMLGNIADGRCMVMIPSVSVSSSYGMPGSLKRTKARLFAVGIGERDLGAVVLVALLAAVEQDAVFRHLGHERLLAPVEPQCFWAASQALVASCNIVSKLPFVVISVMPWLKPGAKERQGDFLEKATNISASRIAGLSGSTWSLTPALAASARPE